MIIRKWGVGRKGSFENFREGVRFLKKLNNAGSATGGQVFNHPRNHR